MLSSHYLGAGRIEAVAAEPQQPKAGEVRLRVASVGICGTDLHIYHGRFDKRVKAPATIGHEMSGVVDLVGPGVAGWAAGDHATVRPLRSCGTCWACRNGCSHICERLDFVGIDSPGAFQESWCVPAALLHRLPAALPLDVAALVEPLAVAMHDLRRGRLAAGEHAVVLGAGPIGMLVAMAARAAGAEVLVAEIDQARRAFAAGLGFITADPAAGGVEAAVKEWSAGKGGADVVFECTGAAPAVALMTSLPRVRGRMVAVGIPSAPPAVDLHRMFWRELELIGARVYEAADFDAAITALAAGREPFATVITARFPLAEIGAAFGALAAGGQLKVLVQCGGGV